MNTEMIEIIRDYFKTQPVLKAWIFGSYARGEETEDSDVDILVIFDRKNNSLETLLQRKVDLVEEGTLLPFAVKSASKEKKIVYERAS